MKRKIKKGIKLLTGLIEKFDVLADWNRGIVYNYRAYGLMTQHEFDVSLYFYLLESPFRY